MGTAATDYRHALRVTFAYDPKAIRVKRVKRIAMRVLAPANPAPEEGTSGHWLTVEDGKGRVMYHMALHNPLRRDYEIHTAEPGQHPNRIPAIGHSGTFEVLIPEVKGARRLVLHGPRRTADGEPYWLRHAAVPLSTQSLAALRKKLPRSRRKAAPKRSVRKKAARKRR